MEKETAYRIQQIRHGEVPKGYRKTLWGVAPLTWNRQTVGELCVISSGSTPSRSNPDYYMGDILWVTSGELKSKYLFNTLEKISSDAVAAGNLTLYDPGTVVIAIYGLEAEGVRGTASIIAQRCTISQACMAFTQFRSVFNEFFYYWYMLNGSKIGTRFAQGTKQQNLSSEIIAAFPVDFPELEEQRKIVEILVTQDKIIELQQRKLDEIKKLKKAYLGKMFPKRGNNVPEIRFREFSDPWEQRKLGELIIEYKETVDSNCTLPVLTSSKTEGVLLQEEHFGRKQQHDISGYNVLPKNYCTYRNRSDGIDFTFNVNKCCDKGIISKFYPVFYGNNSDTFFISLVLNNSNEVIREIGYTCIGTGQKVLSFSDLKNMNIQVPTYDEQRRVSIYFEKLDDLITLHQRKLGEMKKLKKTLIRFLMAGIVRVKS